MVVVLPLLVLNQGQYFDKYGAILINCFHTVMFFKGLKCESSEQFCNIQDHRRKLLLGPGAQAPHFYDHGARLYDEPPTFVT